MPADTQNYQRVLEAAHRLPPQEQRRLINQLAKKLESEKPIKPLALIGKWAGEVSLSAEDLDEARRECWAGLGDEA